MTEKPQAREENLKCKIQNVKLQSIAAAIGFTDREFVVADTLSFNTLKFKLNSSPTWGHDDSYASSVMNNIIYGVVASIRYQVSDKTLSTSNLTPDTYHLIPLYSLERLSE